MAHQATRVASEAGKPIHDKLLSPLVNLKMRWPKSCSEPSTGVIIPYRHASVNDPQGRGSKAKVQARHAGWQHFYWPTVLPSGNWPCGQYGYSPDGRCMRGLFAVE